MKISSTSPFCSLWFPICQGSEEEEILGEAVVKVDEDIEVRGLGMYGRVELPRSKLRTPKEAFSFNGLGVAFGDERFHPSFLTCFFGFFWHEIGDAHTPWLPFLFHGIFVKGC